MEARETGTGRPQEGPWPFGEVGSDAQTRRRFRLGVFLVGKPTLFYGVPVWREHGRRATLGFGRG